MQATNAKAFKSPLRFVHILARLAAGAWALQLLAIFAIITLMAGDAPNSFTPTDISAHPVTYIVFFSGWALILALILGILACAVSPVALGRVLPWRWARSRVTGLIVVYGALARTGVYRVHHALWSARVLKTLNNPSARAPHSLAPSSRRQGTKHRFSPIALRDHRKIPFVRATRSESGAARRRFGVTLPVTSAARTPVHMTHIPASVIAGPARGPGV